MSGSFAAKTASGEVLMFDEILNTGSTLVREGERLLGKLDMGGALIMNGKLLIVRRNELSECS
jgi:hypothetical protein